MKLQEIIENMEKSGYSEVEVKRWKKHDWLLFKNPPEITYGRIICTCRVEEVPDSSWDRLFKWTSRKNGGVRTQ